ncbi:auxin-induced protein X10A-like [Musa acuminata AAA Group]|uniref:auxin-induced protein X10A-like n=1 Tax=Musa acuminata AAA Group TaxID=214697 RepID=UPI0031D60C74
MAIGMTGLVKKFLACGGRNFRSGLPEGHIWVCVGTEAAAARRLEVEANYLNHPLLEDLLRLSVPEFGYSYEGALRIACDIDFFLYLLDLLRSSDPAVHYMELRDLMAAFYVSAGGSRQHHPSYHQQQQMLLLLLQQL